MGPTVEYNNIISMENLLEAWQEFVCGKRSRKDVQEFERNLMQNIIKLHNDLSAKTYKHSVYHAFNISDPKPRNIHKAAVRDRLLHHALYRKLYPLFDKTFIAHSYSCRVGKGMHKALDTFRSFSFQVSKNHTKTVWVLKCDIRKFFASIDHAVLSEIVADHISDKDIRSLLLEIIDSFNSGLKGTGLPLGNLTSQLLVNVYMNKFDLFVKQKLKIKHYIRYADDFCILSPNKEWLKDLVPKIQSFLWQELRLKLHPAKISIGTVASGVDFLGWVHFPDHRVLRTTTKKRAFRGIRNKRGSTASVQSYLGILRHGNAHKIAGQVRKFAERISH